MEQKQTFIVDIGKTMIDTTRSVSQEGQDKQELYCKCGNVYSFNFKVKRNIIKNHDSTIEDKESVEKIKCPKCKSEYTALNKICLLIPDKKEIFNISFHKHDWVNADEESISTLYKRKRFALYSSKNSKLEIVERIDFVRFNHNTKLITIFINNPLTDDDDNNSSEEKEKNIESISETISLSNLSKFCLFFKFFEFVVYENLELAYLFLESLDRYVVDLDEVKKIVFVKHIYQNHEILVEQKLNGENAYYQMRDNGFGENISIKKTLSFGNYLKNLEELAEIFFAVISFPNLTTIYLTKGKEFLFEFLHSNNICNPNVYFSNDATYPYKIIEVSANYSKTGLFKPFSEIKVKEGEDKEHDKKLIDKFNKSYLKISPVLYKSIKYSTDMDILASMVCKDFLNKTELEYLFQLFEPERLYKLFRQLDKSSRQDIRVTVKHINHILKEKLDDSKNHNNDYLSLYIDTLGTMGLLELPSSTIFKIKNAKDLKDIHDDLAAKYNAVKDVKKADFYKKAVNDFKNLVQVVDDVSFTPIPTLEKLNREGAVMHHCIYTYLDRICNKNYMAFNVQHTISNERATMGLIRSGKELEFEQLKGYCNSRASFEMIQAVQKFCRINDIKVGNRGGDLQPSKSSQKEMDDYLNEDEVKKIRDERKKKEEQERASKTKNSEKSNKKDQKDNKGNSKKFLGIF